MASKFKLDPLMEQYIYVEAGTSIGVRIDYTNKTISLVEKDGSAKRWVFADRTLEYMQGWKNILYVMNHAVQHAEKRLKAYEDKSRDDFVELMFAVAQAEGDENEGSK